MSLGMELFLTMLLPMTMDMPFLVELTPILTIAYGNNCQGTKKGIGPNIYFGITKGIAYTVDFAIGFAMDEP